MFKKVLSQPTQEKLAQLSNLPWIKRCYLAGGTATAIYLGHRFSDDFYFFSKERLNFITYRKDIFKLGMFRVTDCREDTLIGAWKNVKFSILHYPYKIIEKPLLFQGITIASITDIALMKLDAISGRGTRRDFIDIFWIVNHSKKSLLDYVRLMKRKYGENYSIEHLIKSISYFEDAEKDPMPKMIKKIVWEEVRSFFIYQSSLLARKFIF